MASAFLTPIEDEEISVWDIPAAKGDGKALTDKHYEFRSLLEAANNVGKNTKEPLIEQLLSQGAMSVLYGASNVGKTFVAIDMAFRVASGLPFGNLEASPLPIAYIAAEGGPGMEPRLAALVKRFPESATNADKNFHILTTPVNLLDPNADVKPLTADILRRLHPAKPGLVVIDTLFRVMGGGDENSVVDMGLLLKHLDYIRHEAGCHLMIVHHTGKDAARGARGHSSLRAATDTEIEVSRGVIEVTKQRDMEMLDPLTFTLESAAVGFDRKGRPMTSCTITLTGGGGIEGQDGLRSVASLPFTGGVTPGEQCVLDALEALQIGGGSSGRGFSVAAVHTFLADNLSTLTVEAVRLHLRRLLEKNAIRRSGRGQYVRNPVKNPLTVLSPLQNDDDESVIIGQANGQGIFD